MIPIEMPLFGRLIVDRDNGVITFEVEGVRLLRITHLPDPIPAGTSIDLVALPALTSYTPLQPVAPKNEWVKWAEDQGGEIVPLSEDDPR